MSWGYGKENGPKNWVKDYPIAAGERQSPIDIKTADVSFDSQLADNPLSVKYFVEQDMDIENTGQSVKANITEPSVISGGPLGADTYKLAQFHLHWGCNDGQGSEHTVDGKEYPSELHLVHFNEKYGDFGSAADKPDGLAVFGIFLSVGNEHKNFKSFTDCLCHVKNTANHDRVKGQFKPKDLLPENMSNYWTYLGSLTTPPLFESVTWIVFKDVMEVSQSQLQALRSLSRDCDEDHIVDNYRPPCPVGKRTVRAAFK